MLKQSTVLWACLVLILSTGCSRYKTIETSLAESEQFQVQLIHQKTPNGMMVQRDFSHPVQFEVQEIKDIMQSLEYGDPVFLWKEKSRPIFSSQEIDMLAPELAKALTQANSDEMIIFEIHTWKKDLVFGSEKKTTGNLFFRKDGLNWAFGNINYAQNMDGDFFTPNPTEKVPKGTYVNLQGNQKHYTAEYARWYEAKKYPNWVVVPIEGKTQLAAIETKPAPVKPAKVVPAVTQAPPPSPKKVVAAEPKTKPAMQDPQPKKTTARSTPKIQESNPDIRERLRVLKSLKEENLITQKEYESKKQEILGNL